METDLMLHLFIACVALSSGGKPNAPPEDNAIPETARKVLDKATKVEVISLELEDNLTDQEYKDYVEKREGFHGYKPLGSTIIEGEASRNQVIKSITLAIEKSKSDDRGRCFHPRHGLRLQCEKESLDLVICFECWTVLIYKDGKYLCTLAIQREPAGALTTILRDAKIALPSELKKP